MRQTIRRTPLVRAVATVACWAVSSAGPGVWAQTPGNAPPPSGGAFTPHTISVEFAGGAAIESWDRNETREWQAEGSATAWWSARRRLDVGLEIHNLRVFQRIPDAFVQGFSPLVRMRFLERGRWQAFATVGPGLSWSDRVVPVRGTRFNYLFQSDIGVLRAVGRHAHALAGLRFLHLSNNGRAGSGHNPDLQMVGPRIGISLSF